MIRVVRTALRVSNDRLDGEIQDTIDAALLDLKTAGVDTQALDALVLMAVKLYARWKFDFLGKGEEYRRDYNDLKALLATCGDARGGGSDE